MADICKILKEYTGAIKNYCVQNGLSFDKLRANTYCYGKIDGVDDLIFLHHDPTKGGPPWILDETPMPALLEIYLENGNLRFVQTDITHKYLGIADEDGAKERAAAKRTPIRKPALA